MPKIVDVSDLRTDNVVELNPGDFIDFIDSVNPEVIFKDIDGYFIMKEGFCIFTYHYGTYETFEEFREVALEVNEAGFSRIDLYESAKSFGTFENQEDYITFSNGGFAPHYEDYIKAKKGGFKNYRDFKEARLLDIKDAEMFQEFKESDFYIKTYLSRAFESDFYTIKHRDLNKQAFERFKKKEL
ncbi:MAG: hypothetical protein BAJALOKI2v1_320027 [Promethearchaeota archaeon]|nr:MAG: hypothetical protein BAJALOKI2v1_320027 [Candidatus Lokiarchaeota archaeon]